MTNERPSPEQLLDMINAEQARAARGRLKIFFGASAGVGKTYAMLNAARAQAAQGIEVLVGIVETHGRKETEALLEGLPALPLKEISYRDKQLREFDLDGALARKPQLILVDELAHSNVPGSRHPKRWQDIEELLAAGIDVYTTVNVQHLETLNDIISGITGIKVWETLPDRVFDMADEVVIVDLPPDELLQRLKEGKVYLGNQAERAIQNFFRKGNLIALRELALRRTADRVDTQVRQYRREQSVAPVWQTRQALLACVGPGERGARVARNAARMASQMNADWHAVYVETPELEHLPAGARREVMENLKLASKLGAETAVLSGNDAAAEAAIYARKHNLTKLIVGRPQRKRWAWQRSFAQELAVKAPDIDLIQASQENAAGPARPTVVEQFQSLEHRASWQAYAKSALISAIAALLAAPLHTFFDLTNIAMVFLLAVVIVASRYGFGPSVMATFLNVAAFDFFYVPPRYTFAVSDAQYILTFGVMLGVGLLTAHLTTGLKYQANVASSRENRVRALYEMSRELSAALMLEQIAEISQRFAMTEFKARASIFIADDADQLQEVTGNPEFHCTADPNIAHWAFEHASEAGWGTDTLPGSAVLYLPLKAPMRARGVLALQPELAARTMSPEQSRLLDTFARLIAISIERVHYVEVAQSTTVQMESERLRNSLLSAISHDLRTPLAAVAGLAESFRYTEPPPTRQQTEIAALLKDEAMRLNSLVNNLLDMARLQSGTVKLNRQWQPVEEVIGCAIKACAAQLGGHAVNVTLPPDLPLLEFDQALIERVLCNLLENAAKYAGTASRIEIRARAKDTEVEIWVQDNGPGLPAGMEEAIFEKFARGQTESATPGVGLGLAICRSIMQAHGGAIKAENRPEGGARFTLLLPLGQPPALAAEDPSIDAEANK